MRMTHGLASIFFVFAAVSAQPSMAGDHAKRGLDRNKDGFVSREEAANFPGLAKHFDQIDTNKDGRLSHEELVVARKKMATHRFKQIDTNGDGRISHAEADAKAPRIARRFELIDTNRDGFLSKDELRSARKSR